MLQF
jgi:hypothetical protein